MKTFDLTRASVYNRIGRGNCNGFVAGKKGEIDHYLENLGRCSIFLGNWIAGFKVLRGFKFMESNVATAGTSRYGTSEGFPLEQCHCLRWYYNGP